MLAGALATALLLGSCCLTVFGQADSPADLKSQIKQDIGFLKSNVFSFWQQHGGAGQRVWGVPWHLGQNRNPCQPNQQGADRAKSAHMVRFMDEQNALAPMHVTPPRQHSFRHPDQQHQQNDVDVLLLLPCMFGSCRAFSTFHKQGYSSGSPSPQQMAQSAYKFVVDHMRDTEGLWFNRVTREGKVSDSSKPLYGQWFVLYGFR
jgi:hypothetical protein